jgi:hypothetical protein
VIFSAIAWQAGAHHAGLTGLALATASGAVLSGLGYVVWYTVLPALGTASRDPAGRCRSWPSLPHSLGRRPRSASSPRARPSRRHRARDLATRRAPPR